MRISKAKVVAAVAAAGLIAGASTNSRAADMPVKAPAAIAAPNWTGWYVNGGGGYGMWAAEQNTAAVAGLGEPPLPVLQRQGGRGWLGRVGGGYDYQFTSHIVAGVFADFDFSNLKGTIHDENIAQSADIKQTWAWAAGARVGWLVTPSILTYFNAGYTTARFSSGTMLAFDTANPGVPVGTASGFATPAFTEHGWFLGGGTEAALGDGWFWRNEYRYAYYGNHASPNLNVSSPAPFPSFTTINFKPTVQTVTTQIVYKFNPGAAAPVHLAPSATVPANWSGVYVNGGGGYGLWVADEKTSAVAGAVNPTVDVAQRQGGKGWLGRVGAGYDHQFSRRIVAGMFGDFDLTNIKGSLQDADSGLDGKTKETWAWAVGARAGLLISPDTLTYLNGGYTMARFSSVAMTVLDGVTPAFGLGTPSFTTDGWFVGGGMEAALAPGLFWRNEYRYSQFGSSTLADTSTNPAAGIRNNIVFKPAVQTVTTQLVYKFATQ